jgi:hypothetical protein
MGCGRWAVAPALLALVLLGCGAADSIGPPSVSLTCSWAPAYWYDISPDEALCYRVEASDSATRVALEGEACPSEAQRCAIAAPGERVIVYSEQLSAERARYDQGRVPCHTTCDDPW